MQILNMATLAIGMGLLAGCATNMPTPAAQITGSYVSPLKYDSADCGALSNEISSLARRENALVAAQGQRIKTSETQAFWYGYGTGDGVEAAELANVRGEREAVMNSMGKKGCK